MQYRLRAGSDRKTRVSVLACASCGAVCQRQIAHVRGCNFLLLLLPLTAPWNVHYAGSHISEPKTLNLGPMYICLVVTICCAHVFGVNCVQELQHQLDEQSQLVKQERKKREAAERQAKKAHEDKVWDLSQQLHLKQSRWTVLGLFLDACFRITVPGFVDVHEWSWHPPIQSYKSR